jgi:arginine:pyruvate transaminase
MDALERVDKGEDVLLLSVGDPDFATPGYITTHVIEQINAGRTHYSPPLGEPRLREALARLETASTGRTVTVDQIAILPGATSALHSVFSCLLDPGDSVVTPTPMYIGYRDLSRALDIDIVPVALDLPDFELDANKLKAAVTPQTRAILINTPGNPAGNIIPPDTLSDLASFCRQRDLWLICDEVYSLITFDQPHTSLLKCGESAGQSVTRT